MNQSSLSVSKSSFPGKNFAKSTESFNSSAASCFVPSHEDYSRILRPTSNVSTPLKIMLHLCFATSSSNAPICGELPRKLFCFCFAETAPSNPVIELVVDHFLSYSDCDGFLDLALTRLEDGLRSFCSVTVTPRIVVAGSSVTVSSLSLPPSVPYTFDRCVLKLLGRNCSTLVLLVGTYGILLASLGRFVGHRVVMYTSWV